MSAWLLPESIADVLPSEARRIEELRRQLLDRFRTYGYELVMPPLLEYVESLLTGTGHDLDLKTFKLVDQVTGRTMGLRADITPQVARIDAHLLNRKGVTRLCYAGHVVHTRASGLHATREPLQCGAEVYGHAGVEADMEVVRLAVDTLQIAGFGHIRVDLCHADIFAALTLPCGLSAQLETELHGLLKAKDSPALAALQSQLGDDLYRQLDALLSLYGPALGDNGVLSRARAQFAGNARIEAALETLRSLSTALEQSQLAGQRVQVMIDLADLHGYEYHSGVMFSIYAAGSSNALVRGGRYDNVGQVFGRARAATGFSTDLRELVRLAGMASGQPGRAAAIRAPWNDDERLVSAVRALRDAGEIVVQILPGSEREEEEFECDRELVLVDTSWVVKPLTSNQEILK